MPYISKERRECLIQDINPCTPGELNFILTFIILEYLESLKEVVPSSGLIKAQLLPNRYKDYNEIIGVLECCKLEIYRRLVASYEDKKKEENGDVF